LPQKDKQLVLRVVAGHHKSYSRLSTFIQNNYAFDQTEFGREFSKVDVQGVIDIVHSFGDKLISNEVSPNDSLKVIADYQREIRDVSMGRQQGITDYFTLLLLMGAFHHCDHLSSAFVTEI